MNFSPFLARLPFLLAMVSVRLAVQAQIINDFNPKVGTPGDTVNITGSGFMGGGFNIYFWYGRAASIIIVSDNQIQATVPTGITTGPLGIGSGSSINYTTNDYLAIGSGPYIGEVVPNFGGVNDQIVLRGVHFLGATAVKFGGTSASFVPTADGTQITTYVPAGAHSGPISVTTAVGTSNSPSSFTVIGPGPYITSFNPVSGTPGTVVTINGRYFTGATSAAFNGTAGAHFAVVADTQIRVDAPAGVTTGPIAVTSPLGTSITSSNFFVPPTMSSFSPAAGRAGTNVVLTGANFSNATSVTFGGLAADFEVLGNTSIRASVPAGAATGLIRVTAPAGSCFSASNFKMQPLISGFSPNHGPSQTSVIITGANLNEGLSAVKFNNVASGNVTVQGPGQVTAKAPATTTGLISVTTTNGSYTNGMYFYFPASITSFSPNNGSPLSRIQVTGQNFLGATSVAFNGAPALFTVTNNTTLGATVPAEVTTGPITVTTPAGTATSASFFYAAPIINSFVPTHGLPGTNVTILGTNFLDTTVVTFNGTAANIVSVNNGQIVVTVPAGAQTGPITVTAPAGSATSSGSFLIDANDLAVRLIAVPNPVGVTNNLLYAIYVTNTGPSPTLNLRLTNRLPATVSLLSYHISQGSLLTAPGVNPLVFGLGSVGVGATASANLTVVPQATGSITNSIGTASDYPDPVPANNSASAITEVLPILSLHLLSTNQVSVSWRTGAVYQLEYRNQLVTTNLWSNVLASVAVSNTENVVIETNRALLKFYRLRK